jgi:hypothetical protein
MSDGSYVDPQRDRTLAVRPALQVVHDQRRHSTFGYMSPVEFERFFASA